MRFSCTGKQRRAKEIVEVPETQAVLRAVGKLARRRLILPGRVKL